VGGDSKIPSILYYNQDGELRAVGAEALQESVIEQAEEEGWVKLEWFCCFLVSISLTMIYTSYRWKLHLRPKGLATSHVSDDDLPALPQNKSAVQILGDFMRYLYQCAHTYIHDTYSPELWKSVENDIDFVLTHPNGWEGAQQSQIRSAAVLAGLITDTPDGHSRLQLLTEGEASLHFCLNNGVTSESMMVGIFVLYCHNR